MAIRTGWLNDVDLTGRSWWDVAQQVNAVGGSAAVTQLLNANFFEQFGSFSAGDRAKLWEYVGGSIAGEQAAADKGFSLGSVVDAITGITGLMVGGATTGAAASGGLVPVSTGLMLDKIGASAALTPWLSSALSSAKSSVTSWLPQLPQLPTVPSFGSWQDSYFDAAAALNKLVPDASGDWLPSFTDQSGGDAGMDLRDMFRSVVASFNDSPATTMAAAAMPGAAFPQLAMGAMPTLGRIGAGMLTAGSAAVGVLRSVGGKILGVMLPSGVKVSRKAVVSLAKTMGIQGAATALGIGAVELAEMVMQESGGRRGRGRGVSAAQLRTTRRTMRTVERMHKQILGYCRETGHGPRRPRTIYVGPSNVKQLPFRRG